MKYIICSIKVISLIHRKYRICFLSFLSPQEDLTVNQVGLKLITFPPRSSKSWPISICPHNSQNLRTLIKYYLSK